MSASIVFVGVSVQIFVGYVHLATENGDEGVFASVLELAVFLVYVIEKFFNAEHVAVVGDGQTRHTVGDCFIYELIDGRLTIEQ